MTKSGRLFDTVRRLISEDNYLVGDHALERLAERGIMEWQVVAGVANGSLIVEQPAAEPNPTVEILEMLPDGTDFKAVWAHIAENNVAKLVTVHFFDR